MLLVTYYLNYCIFIDNIPQVEYNQVKNAI